MSAIGSGSLAIIIAPFATLRFAGSDAPFHRRSLGLGLQNAHCDRSSKDGYESGNSKHLKISQAFDV